MGTGAYNGPETLPSVIMNNPIKETANWDNIHNKLSYNEFIHSSRSLIDPVCPANPDVILVSVANRTKKVTNYNAHPEHKEINKFFLFFYLVR